MIVLCLCVQGPLARCVCDLYICNRSAEAVERCVNLTHLRRQKSTQNSKVTPMTTPRATPSPTVMRIPGDDIEGAKSAHFILQQTLCPHGMGRIQTHSMHLGWGRSVVGVMVHGPSSIYKVCVSSL